MQQLPTPPEGLDLWLKIVLGFIALGTAVGGLWKWLVRPLRQRQAENAKKIDKLENRVEAVKEVALESDERIATKVDEVKDALKTQDFNVREAQNAQHREVLDTGKKVEKVDEKLERTTDKVSEIDTRLARTETHVEHLKERKPEK